MQDDLNKSGLNKRDEILSVAKGFFYSKGYEKTSIQNIIDGANTAKGTFYHYFKSKEDLLNQMTDADTKKLYKSLYDILKVDLNAIEKLNLLFQRASGWKSENIPMMKVLVAAIMSDANILLRHTILKSSVAHISPIYESIIRQGVEEGLIHVNDVAYTAKFLMTGFMGNAQEMQSKLLMEQFTESLAKEFRALIINFEDTLERILGAKSGTIHIINDVVLDKLLKDLLEA